MGRLSLRVFGTIHVDRVGKVADELDGFAAGVDALFLEYPVDALDRRFFARVLARAPLVLLGWALYVAFLWPLYALLVRDLRPVEAAAAERVAGERDLAVHAVDPHLRAVAAEPPIWWTAVDWLALLALVSRAPVPVAVTFVAVAGSWLVVQELYRWRRRVGTLLAPLLWWIPVALWQGTLSADAVLIGVVALLAALARAHATRNRSMLDRTASVADEEDYDAGCLVTGRAHVDGLVAAAADAGVRVTRTKRSKAFRRSDVETVDPTPGEGGGLFEHPTPSLYTQVTRRRGAAAVVDVLALAALSVALAFGVGLAAGLALGGAAVEAGVYAGFALAPVVYFVGLEALFGQTVGKRLFGLVVSTTDGERCSLRAAALRNALRPVDFLVGYLLGYVVMAMNRDRRRLGDLAAGTVVSRAAADREMRSP